MQEHGEAGQIPSGVRGSTPFVQGGSGLVQGDGVVDFSCMEVVVCEVLLRIVQATTREVLTSPCLVIGVGTR